MVGKIMRIEINHKWISNLFEKAVQDSTKFVEFSIFAKIVCISNAVPLQ